MPIRISTVSIRGRQLYRDALREKDAGKPAGGAQAVPFLRDAAGRTPKN